MAPNDFDGSSYDDGDHPRLSSQLHAVRDCMMDHIWRIPEEIMATGVRGTTASITARLRDLRKTKHGGFIVEARRRAGSEGVFEYRVLIPEPVPGTPDHGDLDAYDLLGDLG